MGGPDKVTCSLDFVASIAASPTVRLNLSDGPQWIINRDETDFSPPPLRRAIAQTLLTDGGVIPSSAYDFRRISLALFLHTDNPDTTATAVQALHRELDRPGGNILRWHEHTTHPVFFRTFRASASAVRWLGRDGKHKRIAVDLLAEPFAYGLVETPVSGVTVSTDPAAVSNPCFVDVTGVKGDVEAPAIIRWPSAAIGNFGQETLFAVRRRGTPSSAPFLFQAEAMTQGTDTTTQINDANFSGAGNNYSRCTFSTATMQTRLSTLDLGTASVDLRGRYRVFLRYRKNTSDDGINLKLTWGDADSWVIVSNDTYATFNTTQITTADLGEINVPFGQDPVTGSDGVELVTSDSFALRVRAERISGSGTIDFDFLLFVPSDDRLGIVKWADEQSSPTDHWILDAASNSAHARNAAGQVISAGAPALSGGLSMLSPGQTNRIYMLRRVDASGSYTLTTVTPVSISYLPRYLSVRPAST